LIYRITVDVVKAFGSQTHLTVWSSYNDVINNLLCTYKKTVWEFKV